MRRVVVVTPPRAFAAAGMGGLANTSLRRDDTGNGACETVYVDTLEVL